jgi:hypothetical protein
MPRRVSSSRLRALPPSARQQPPAGLPRLIFCSTLVGQTILRCPGDLPSLRAADGQQTAAVTMPTGARGPWKTVIMDVAPGGPPTWCFSSDCTVLNKTEFLGGRPRADLARSKLVVQIPSPPPTQGAWAILCAAADDQLASPQASPRLLEAAPPPLPARPGGRRRAGCALPTPPRSPPPGIATEDASPDPMDEHDAGIGIARWHGLAESR